MADFAPFTVEVPATTANLGPGFDVLGMSLDLWNQVNVVPSTQPEMVITGEGAEVLPTTTRNLMFRAANLGADHLGITLPFFRLEACNAVPLARGLGSSAAAAVAGLMITNHIAGKPLDLESLLNLAVRLEGHPDNAAPALWGGACLVVQDEEDGTIVRQIEVAEGLTCVAFIPTGTLPTRSARSVLPGRVPATDAIFNVSRTALLVRALMTGDWDDLRLATQDRLHQPYRSDLVPGMETLFSAALDADAYGVFLSGAGPTVLALASPKRSQAVADAFMVEARSRGIDGDARVIAPSREGARVVEG